MYSSRSSAARSRHRCGLGFLMHSRIITACRKSCSRSTASPPSRSQPRSPKPPRRTRWPDWTVQAMILLVGGDSEIGAATKAFLAGQGHLVAATTRRADRASADRPWLDLAAPLDAWEPPAGTRSTCIFAAIARLAACAADPVGTAHVNVSQTLT